MRNSAIFFVACTFIAVCVCDYGFSQEIPSIKRRLPAPGGLQLPDDQLSAARKELGEYKERLWEISNEEYSGDVEAIFKAVDLALDHKEFYSEKHFALVDKYLQIGKQRFNEVYENEAHPWTKETGLIVRGYRSSVDDSCQPYGLEVSDKLDLSKPVPLIVWLHGRGDKITDLHFMERCATKHQAFGGFLGEQSEAIVVHPFGRQCVGWKHAGEIDVLEVIEAVKRDYPIDSKRIVLAGFSMGGAGVWHIGAHYHDRFCAIAPGAGFAETARYNKLKPEDYPPKIEQTLWGVYDVPNYRRNFLNGPLLAYSGEKDKQKAAADLMAVELAKEGLELRHVIGSEMAHKYNQESVDEIWSWIKESWNQGNPSHPKSIRFQTRTLRYSSYKWVRITGLEKHWQDTRVDADWDEENKRIVLELKNVASIEIQAKPDQDIGDYTLLVNGQTLKSSSPGFPVDTLSIHKPGSQWEWGEFDGQRKKPTIQGPIDDAFMSNFLIVPPKGEIKSPKLKRWVDFELKHFRARWRALMRGKTPEIGLSGLDSYDIDNSNLILWGDPSSNKVLAEIIDKLPIKWDSDHFEFQGKKYSTADHVPTFIFPNPLNPNRYVVINSGLTFREDHDRTNSLQNPKLGDWAIIDLDQLPNGSAPGKIVDTGFFDETWR